MSIYRDVVTVDESKGIIKKKVDSIAFAAQVQKVKNLEKLFSNLEGVEIPSLVDIDHDNCELIFEFIDDLVSLRPILKDRELSVDLVDLVGKGIATVHSKLILDEKHKVILPPPFDKYKKYNAFLHLDFNTVNVQYSPKRKTLYFIDWEMSPLLGGYSNYGSIYFDLAFFCYQIYNTEPYLFTGRKQKDLYISTFLKAYESINGKIDFNEFYLVANDYYKVFKPFEEIRRFKALLKYFNYKDFELFLGRLNSSYFLNNEL